MKCVTKELECNNQNIKIIPISDCHIGSSKFLGSKLESLIDEVKNEPNTYCVLAGDLINNATKTSVSDIYSEALSPMESLKVAIELFRPIKDKILAVVSGNHEERTYRMDGIDLTQFFCNELGLSECYNPTSVCLFLKFGKNLKASKKTTPCVYTMFIQHGSGGGRTVGGLANTLARRGEIINTDIVIIGHTHRPVTFRECRYEVDIQNGYVREKETVFVNTCSQMGYEAYAEKNALKPTSTVNPEIILNHTYKAIRVLS